MPRQSPPRNRSRWRLCCGPGGDRTPVMDDLPRAAGPALIPLMTPNRDPHPPPRSPPLRLLADLFRRHACRDHRSRGRHPERNDAMEMARRILSRLEPGRAMLGNDGDVRAGSRALRAGVDGVLRETAPKPTMRHGASSAIGPRGSMRCGIEESRCRCDEVHHRPTLR